MTWTPLARRAGRHTDVRFDADGRVVFRTLQDCDPTLELNHALRTSGRKNGQDVCHVAAVPLVILHKWLVEEGLDVFNHDHQDRLAKKLNDPEYAYLRTGGGRLGVSNGICR